VSEPEQSSSKLADCHEPGRHQGLPAASLFEAIPKVNPRKRECLAIGPWGRSISAAAFSAAVFDQGGDVRIEIRGRNVQVTEELREHVEKRFRRIGNQVSDLAQLDVELSAERNPSISDNQVAEATLHLKGVTLRAREASPDMMHTIHELAEDMRRQVKRHREKRRNRRKTRRMMRALRGRSAES
jgi:putative sigma-54 modulation protein